MNWYKTAQIDKIITKTAVADGEFRDLKTKVNNLKDDIQGLKKEDRDIDSRLKKLERAIDSLNIGNRQFWQVTNSFTSIQRKIEQFDRLEQEWKNFKKDLTADIKKQIDQNVKATIKPE